MEQARLSQSRLASSFVILLGAWIMLSPIFISVTGGALTSLLITGGVMILSSLVQFFWENSLPSWINTVAAMWLFVSAFAFIVSSAVGWNQVISATVAFLLSTWDGVEISEAERLHHIHAAM